MALDQMTDSDAISNQLRSPEARPRNSQNIVLQEKEKDIISRLPFEISSMIFQLAQVESSFLDNVPMRFAHRVTSVCRTWRAMALANPLLWSHIQISMICGIPRAIVALWLQRSADMPLYLQFTHTKSYRNSYPVSPIMSLLQSQIHRWRSLYINVNFSDTFNSYVVRHLVGTANALHHFSLELTGFFAGVFDSSWMARFICPNLHTLMVDNQVVHAITMDPQLRRVWNIDRLQSLGVHHKRLLDTVDEVHATLRDVSQVAGAVTSLFLRGFHTDSPQQQVSIPPGLPGCFPPPNLVKVRFQNTHFRIVRDFLESNSALSLAEVGLDDIFPDQSNVDFVSDLPLKLLSLTNIGGITGRAQFRPYLLDCNHLFVSFSRKFDDALLALMSKPDANGRWICPHLESMELYQCSNISERYLSALIVSRSNVSGPSVTAIKRLVVNSQRSISDENRDWFTRNLEYFLWVKYRDGI